MKTARSFTRHVKNRIKSSLFCSERASEWLVNKRESSPAFSIDSLSRAPQSQSDAGAENFLESLGSIEEIFQRSIRSVNRRWARASKKLSAAGPGPPDGRLFDPPRKESAAAAATNAVTRSFSSGAAFREARETTSRNCCVHIRRADARGCDNSCRGTYTHGVTPHVSAAEKVPLCQQSAKRNVWLWLQVLLSWCPS